MNYTLAVLFSFSIAIAAIIGLVRFKQISPAYYPFLFCIWLAFLNEILNYILARTIGHNIINNNIYALLEALLITWQFKKWGLFYRSNYSYAIILGLFISGWLFEILFISNIRADTYYFQV